MKSLYRVIMLLLIVASLVTACGATPEPTPAPTEVSAAPTGEVAQPADTPVPPEPTETPGPHGKLVIAGTVRDLFAPQNMLSNHEDGNAVFDGLTWPREKGVLEPMLATSWKVLEDGVTWEFKLREGVTFDNGEPFNAEVVKWNVETVLNEKLRWYGRLATIKEVQVIDDYTVHIITYAPDPLVPGRMRFFMMPPKAVEEAGGLEEYAKKPAGTGSYVVEEFMPLERLVLKYRPDSWHQGVVGVPDKPLEIEWIHMADPASRVAALRAGDVDVALNVPFDEVAALESEGFVATSAQEASPVVVFLDVFSEDSPFRDKLVRQAVNYAVDKEAMINDLYLGYPGEEPGQLAAQDGVGYNPDIDAYPYDPEKARELLAEAGYPDGFDTQFEITAGNVIAGETTGEAIAAYLADVGINVEIIPLESATWIGKWYGGGRAPMFIGMVNYLPLYDVDFSYSWFWSGNQPAGAVFFKDDRFDELFEASRLELDPDKRQAMLLELAEIHHEEAPVIYLFRQGRVHVMNPRVKGLETYSDQMFYLDFVSLEE